MKEIGIFGGSFNPVHAGHMIVADYMAQFGGYDEVWLTLSPLNPLKAGEAAREFLPDSQRLEMLRLAVGNCPRLKVCDIELKLPRPSYSFVTLDTLGRLHPDCHFSMIVGSDNWQLFDRWRNAHYILETYGVTVYPRPGYPVETGVPGMRLVNAPVVELSSTFVRDAIASGHDMTFFLPPNVMDYITRNNLYKQ